MSPKKHAMKPADRSWGKGRLMIGQKYHEVADLVTAEGGVTINVCVGLCVLAGIAASDAICALATGERYSGTDHAAAADALVAIDKAAGESLRKLVAFKSKAHYGTGLLTEKDRKVAMRSAEALLERATALASPLGGP